VGHSLNASRPPSRQVDSFFFMSGFLASFHLLDALRKLRASKGSIASFWPRIPMLYLMRYIRLTPTYFYVLLMYW
jgi:peptidoglycan/LPS O-acetylase OafA/YrhL